MQGGRESRARAWGESVWDEGGKGVGGRDISGDASGYGAGQGEGMGGHKRQPGVCPRVYPCLHTSALQVSAPAWCSAAQYAHTCCCIPPPHPLLHAGRAASQVTRVCSRPWRCPVPLPLQRSRRTSPASPPSMAWMPRGPV
jgi:hypothetical protein